MLIQPLIIFSLDLNDSMLTWFNFYYQWPNYLNKSSYKVKAEVQINGSYYLPTYLPTYLPPSLPPSLPAWPVGCLSYMQCMVAYLGHASSSIGIMCPWNLCRFQHSMPLIELRPRHIRNSIFQGMECNLSRTHHKSIWSYHCQQKRTDEHLQSKLARSCYHTRALFLDTCWRHS